MLTQKRCLAPEFHSRMRRPLRTACFFVAQVAILMTCGNVAFADVPAETDFGMTTTTTVTSSWKPSPTHALFVTRYANGLQREIVMPIRGDAVVSFAGEHGSWKLDVGLTWFMQMPVYVRTLPIPDPHADADRV